MKKKFSLLLIVFTVCVAYAKELTFPIFAGSFEYMPIKQVDDLFCSSVDIGAYFFNESVFSVNKAEDEKSERSDSDDYRNGYKSKTVKSRFGKMEIEVPQDRRSTFEPQVVKKGQKT